MEGRVLKARRPKKKKKKKKCHLQNVTVSYYYIIKNVKKYHSLFHQSNYYNLSLYGLKLYIKNKLIDQVINREVLCSQYFHNTFITNHIF